MGEAHKIALEASAGFRSTRHRRDVISLQIERKMCNEILARAREFIAVEMKARSLYGLASLLHRLVLDRALAWAQNLP
jgi:hypothetical protein